MDFKKFNEIAELVGIVAIMLTMNFELALVTLSMLPVMIATLRKCRRSIELSAIQLSRSSPSSKSSRNG